MKREEFLAALAACGWKEHETRAHCVEFRNANGRWIEVWDNGDSAFGVNTLRACVGDYERICGMYVDEGAVRRSRLRRINAALAESDTVEMSALLNLYRKDLTRG